MYSGSIEVLLRIFRYSRHMLPDYPIIDASAMRQSDGEPSGPTPDSGYCPVQSYIQATLPLRRSGLQHLTHLT